MFSTCSASHTDMYTTSHPILWNFPYIRSHFVQDNTRDFTYFAMSPMASMALSLLTVSPVMPRRWTPASWGWLLAENQWATAFGCQGATRVINCFWLSSPVTPLQMRQSWSICVGFHCCSMCSHLWNQFEQLEGIYVCSIQSRESSLQVPRPLWREWSQ